MNEHKDPPEVNASADVVQDAPVTLWKGGVSVVASSRDVAQMQREGWLLRSPEDIPGLLSEIRVYCDTLKSNISEFVEAVQADGHIDPQDGAIYAASLKTRSLLDQRINDLLGIIHQAYPMRQAEGAKLADGRVVDPSQVELFSEAGAEDGGN